MNKNDIKILNEAYAQMHEAKARPSVFDEPSEQEGQTKIEWIWAAPDAETARQRFIKVVKETDMISEPQKAEMIRNAMEKKTKSDMDVYAHNSRMTRLGMGSGRRPRFEARDPYQRDWGDEDMDNDEISSGSDYLDTAMGDLLEALEFADWNNLNPDWAKYMAKNIFIPLAKGKEYIANADQVYSNLPNAFYQNDEQNEDGDQAENESTVNDAADIFVRELKGVGEINPAWAKIWLDHLFIPMAKGEEVDLDTVRQLLNP